MEKEVTRWILERKPVNTATTYNTYLRQFEDWCTKQGAAFFPAKPAVVARFAIFLESKGLRASTIKVALAAISSQYSLSHFPSPTLDPIVRSTIKIISEIATPPTQKLPLTVEMVAAIAQRHDQDDSFAGIRNTCMIILMVAAFLRESEATALRKDEVWLDSIPNNNVAPSSSSSATSSVTPALFFFIERSKTVRDRRGYTVIVPASANSLICPHRWFNRYSQARAREKVTKSEFFFHNEGSSEKLADTTPNHIVKRELEAIGVDPARYGSHSCRSGGVSEAADKGCPVEILKRHGHWTSDAVYNYMRDSWERKMLARPLG